MFALILAGGKGERLRPLTDSMPKPMVPVGGQPILRHQINWLKQVGVTDVVFLAGYRWQDIQDYFGDGSGFGVRTHYSLEESPLGRGGAIKQGFSLVPEEEESVMVLNGDIITAQAPGEVLQDYRAHRDGNPGHMATIMVVPMVSPYGLVDTETDGRVSGFREKAELPYWINAGVYVFNRAIAPQLPDLGDHETETFPGLAASGGISAVKSREFWRSVDSFKDLREAEEFVLGSA